MKEPRRSIRKLGWGGLLLVILTLTIPSKTATPPIPEQADNEYQIGGVLWQEASAESRALQYQAYTLGRLMLDRDFRLYQKSRLKRAVVVDVDETVLDNSRYQAELIVNRQPFTSASWIDWCNRAKASAIPGAVEFLKYAATRGVRVFYVTNRRETEKTGTITNLKQLSFPDVSDETVVVRTGVSSKEPRRQSISRRYRIVLLFGDNLSDFSNAFEGKTPEERAAAVEAARQKFGDQFIVLPNPMYGDWENAIYGYESGLSEQQKAVKRKAALKTISSP
ncbi:MAG TPA: 5'-nucleotidase, lipoprotein e(P4) family [Blastocatellia bacterium]|nr:5'-nucleotidase, lipoprotein e(P4) family [Blastocatellia bacterium]